MTRYTLDFEALNRKICDEVSEIMENLRMIQRQKEMAARAEKIGRTRKPVRNKTPRGR